MKFLTISGIGFVIIGVVFTLMSYYLRVDREASRIMADRSLRMFCAPHDLAFTANHLGVASGTRNRYSWRVEVSFLTPHDQVVEAPPLGRMALKRNLPLKKRVLFDFIRDPADRLVLTGFREDTKD